MKVKPVRKSLKIKTKSPENKRNTLTQLENFFNKPTREHELKGLFNVSRVNKPKSANKTVKHQRGIKKEQIKGKWETYKISELYKLLVDHKVPKSLFNRGTIHAKLVELAYKYVK